MKKTKFTGKTDKDLEKILGEKKDELSSFKFGISGSRTKDLKAGQKLRREIASVLTQKAKMKS